MMSSCTDVWILRILTFMFPLLSGRECCPSPYTDYPSELCLFYRSSSKSWYEAREDCISVMGDLVKEDTAEVRAVCTNILQSSGNRYWISLNDILTEGDYVWADGEGVSWTNWDLDQPDGGPNQRCVLSFIGDNDWADRSCSQSNDYICQFKGCRNGTTLSKNTMSTLENVEVTASLAVFNRAECASKCYRRSVCDGIVYSQTTFTCHVLKLKEGSSVPQSVTDNSEVYFPGRF